MTTDPILPVAQRKQLLILQGQVFRAGVVEAQNELRSSLEPKALLGSVASNLVGAGTAQQLLSLSSLLDGRLNVLLPVALKTLGFLARRKLLRPAGLALAAGAAGWAAYRKLRPSSSNTAPASSDDDGEDERIS